MTSSSLLVVGVDGSDGGRRALTWAVHEAARTGSAVQAVTAWHWDGLDAEFANLTTPDAERERAEKIAAHDIADVTAGLSGHVPVALEVVAGQASDVLTAAARTAHLLVLGSHGHGALHHAVLGSVAEACIRKAACPVVVIPVPRPAHDPNLPATGS
ncbi:universal stress protein [Longispora urticae]